VPAHDGAAGLHHLGKPSGEYLLQDRQIALLGETNNRKGTQRRAPHGVDVAQRVDRGDLAEGVGIVDHRREEVHGLDQGLAG